jgi:hypothetical protein
LRKTDVAEKTGFFKKPDSAPALVSGARNMRTVLDPNQTARDARWSSRAASAVAGKVASLLQAQLDRGGGSGGINERDGQIDVERTSQSPAGQ